MSVLILFYPDTKAQNKQRNKKYKKAKKKKQTLDSSYIPHANSPSVAVSFACETIVSSKLHCSLSPQETIIFHLILCN